MHKIKAILYVICGVLVPIILANTFLYIIGAFIAWDTNPLHWWMLTSITGRCLYVVYNIAVLASVPTFWEEFGN
jgi:hypothetical protein